MSHECRGFKSREDALFYQIEKSVKPAYCAIHPAFKGDTFVVDPINHAGGRVFVWSYKARSRDGKIRTYFASYVGA